MNLIFMIKIRWSVIAGLIMLFTLACVGGEVGTNITPDPPPGNADTTPDSFTFVDQTTSVLSEAFDSNAVVISGIDQPASVSITGGQYQINSGSFTAANGTVVVNDSIVVRLDSAALAGQTNSSVLTVGGVSDSFDITTEFIITRNSTTACIAPEQADSSNANIQIENAFPNISVSQLVGLFQSPGDTSRWYAMSQSGQIFWFDNLATASTLNEFVDLRSLVRNSGEQGLLGLAFDPQYSTNGIVYFSYVNNNSESIIARFVNQGSLPLDISNPDILLTLSQPASNHNGGNIAFGPDGFLYIGFGDGGGANDTFNNGQNTQSLHGTILRIDVSSSSYTIPADNPFVADANVLDEIFAYGLRNPWRWSFDAQTGDLWVADVGQGTYEEVDIVQAGNNLGWPIMEGDHCFNSASCDMTGLTRPVAEYDHSSGDCSITGGFVYRGQTIPSLQGHFIYGDFCSGTVRTVAQQADQSYLAAELLASGQSISSFAQGPDGEVLMLSISGSIFRFVDAQAGAGNIPDNLSETGCFSSTENKTYPNFVVPYDVQSRLWSDGEDKTRYLAIPDGSNIDVLADGDFIFPDQTILVKNFISNNTYLETRLFMKHVTGWAGYSYQWLDDQSDAVLVDGDTPQAVVVNNIAHTIPARGQCFTCHTSAANNTLGLEASQLNSTIQYPNNSVGNQLDALAGSGYLAVKPSATQISEIARIDDLSASVEIRARSYLHSNCSGCHRPGGPASQIDFRIQTELQDSMTCNVTPENGDLGINNARIIAAGDANRSVLIARMQSLDSDTRMPPLATQVVHEEAVIVISEWINGLTGC